MPFVRITRRPARVTHATQPADDIAEGDHSVQSTAFREPAFD
jgi:hypothetical protein